MEQNGLGQQEQFGRKCLAESGIAYTAAAVIGVLLSLLLSSIASAAAGETYSSQDWYLYLSYLIAQVSFAIAAGVYFARSKEPVKRVVKGCKWQYFPIALLLQFGLLFSLSELNGLFIRLLEKIGYVQQGTPVPDLTGWNLLPALLVIALLPALFEETLFRGILSRKMHDGGWGLVPTVLLSGALFSLFHGSPEQTVYQFFCGICFSLVAVRAGSILPTVLSHFCNNALILILTAAGKGDLSQLPLGGYLAVIISSAICLLGTLVYLIFFDKNGNRRGGVKNGAQFALAAGGGILVCAIEWIAVLAMGFIK